MNHDFWNLSHVFGSRLLSLFGMIFSRRVYKD